MDTVKLLKNIDDKLSSFFNKPPSKVLHFDIKIKESKITSKIIRSRIFELSIKSVAKTESFDNKCLFTNPVPLYNSGNNCYINSSMQSLFPTINKELLMALRHARGGRTPAIELFNIYIDHMERRSHAWNPASNIHNLKYFSKNFRNGAQEDAQEFLNGFLDRLREEFDTIDRFKGVNNPIRAAYAPSYDCRYFCTRCMKSNLKSPQVQEELTFFVEVAEDLPSMLKAALGSRTNGYSCEYCATKDGSAKMSGEFTSLPRAFICCVKRFRHQAHGGGSKVHRKVEFTRRLRLPFVDLETEHRRSEQYELSSIVIHSGGSLHSGHYECVSRVGEQWYRISDSSVRAISEGQAQASVGSSSYIYIYTRVAGGAAPMATAEARLPQAVATPTRPTPTAAVEPWRPQQHKQQQQRGPWKAGDWADSRRPHDNRKRRRKTDQQQHNNSHRNNGYGNHNNSHNNGYKRPRWPQHNKVFG